MQYKKGKPAYTSQTPKNQPSNQYRQWLRQTQPDSKTLKNPHKINDQLASHQSSIIYEHIRNMGIEDDLPPALLDLSLQLQGENTGQTRENLRSSRDTLGNNKKDKKYLKSIYIEQEQTENTYQDKNNNARNFGTQSIKNNQANKEIASMESSLNFYDGMNFKSNNNRTNNMNMNNAKRLQQIQRVDEQQNIAITTFQIYSALIQQPRFTSLNNSTATIKTTNKTVTSTALQQPQLSHIQKEPKQQLASILLNSNKLLSYVQRLTELQINKHNQVRQIYQHGNEKIMDHKKQDHAQIQNQARIQKQKAQILGMLACLMIKIRQGSQRCNGLLPEIIKNKQGQIIFNFGAPKNSNSIHNLTKYSSKKQQLSSQINQSQKVVNLNKKLAQQDSLLQKIKQEYDTIINNYMTTIASLMMENKQKQERFSKSQDNQKGKNMQTKNIDKYSSDEKDKSSSDLMRGDSKVSEIIKSHQIIDKDEQLERLILSSNKMDTLDVFNRLSADSKRKSKSRIGEVQKLQFSFQKQ